MRRRLHDRLLYITCSQNWDAIGPHYWIKQCIELLLVTATEGTPIQMSHESSILPNISAVINSIDPKKKKEFLVVKQENQDIYDTDEIREEVLDMDLSNVDSNPTLEEKLINRTETISKLITKHYEFIEVSKNVTTDQFLVAAAQLCHMDTALAEQVWLQLFPKLWNILDEQQRSVSGNILHDNCFSKRKNLVVSARNPAVHHIWHPYNSERLLSKCHQYFC